MEVLHRGRRALKPGKGQIRDWPGRQSRRGGDGDVHVAVQPGCRRALDRRRLAVRADLQIL